MVTSKGQAYWIKVHELPEGTRNSKGSHIKAILAISPDEEITAIVSFDEFSESRYLLMATFHGVIKKVELSLFRNAKTKGIHAINLDEGDRLVNALLTSGDDEVVIVSKKGQALRFSETDVRSMGRTSRGFRGMNLAEGDNIAGLMRVDENEKMLLITDNGYGKRIEYSNFNRHARGTKGQICYKFMEKSGEIVGTLSVTEEHDLMCITSLGLSVRTEVGQISVQGKAASGVRVVTIQHPDQIVAIARTEAYKEEDFEEDEE